MTVQSDVHCSAIKTIVDDGTPSISLQLLNGSPVLLIAFGSDILRWQASTFTIKQ
jgi:hypothetical protein